MNTSTLTAIERRRMEPVERLRRLTFNLERSAEDADMAGALDGRTLALARIAALVAICGPEPSFDAEVDLAIGEGATDQEIVAVLAGVIPVVGMAKAVAAAPMLTHALGYEDPIESS